jgi:hypothetical protein
VLEVSLTLYVTRAGFEALSKLPHLQQFIFGNYMPRNDWLHEIRYLRLCTKYLPHLKVAGRHFDVMNVDDQKLNCLKFARGYHSDLVQLKRPPTLSLELLNRLLMMSCPQKGSIFQA